MNHWLVAAVVLIVALAPCLIVCLVAEAADGLAAVEVAGPIAVSILMLLSEGTHRQPFIDLALTLTLTVTIGAFVFARMMEHEL